MPSYIANSNQPVVIENGISGYAVIPTNSPLTFLNYYDGKYLRASDLELEQQGLRNLTFESNKAGGSGIVNGYDCQLENGSIRVGPGLAIDPSGRVLLLPGEVTVSIDEMLDRSFSATTAEGLKAMGAFEECEPIAPRGPDTVISGVEFYIVTACYAQAKCGEDDVYGKLCEEACITSTDRLKKIDGVAFNLEPLPALTLPVSSSQNLTDRHLRSRVATAFFDYEKTLVEDLISAEGLSRNRWCFGAGADPRVSNCVPIGLLARSGSSNLFIDRWIVARERMETPPRRFWAHIMAMRPWNTFLAQVLQFQCQLSDMFRNYPKNISDDPCADERAALRIANAQLEKLMAAFERSAGRLADRGVNDSDNFKALKARIARISGKTPGILSDQYLIDGGIGWLPAGGYLPVDPGSEMAIDEQVRRLMGKGVDLRFCSVRADFVPHALEEVQHMDRISLVQGLDNPANKEKVDILIPDGEIEETSATVTGTGYEMTLDLSPLVIQLLVRTLRDTDDAAGTSETIGTFNSGAADFSAGDTMHSVLLNARAINMAAPNIIVGATDNKFQPLSFSGAARGEQLPGGGFGFHYAGAFKQDNQEGPPAFTLIELLRHAGIWISAELDRDPFNLNRNESSRTNGEMIILIPGRILRVVFNGDLQLLQIVQQPGRQQLITRLSTTLTTSMTNLATGQEHSNVAHSTDRVEISRLSDGSSKPTIEVDFPNPSILGAAKSRFRFDSIRKWADAIKATVSGGISVINPQQKDQPAAPSFTLIELNREIPLFAADQKINPAVLAPAHSAHESAITAIRAIGGALQQPEFEEIAVRKLFPPPKADVSNVEVKGPHDWVLFHRRRDKRCTGENVPRPDVPTRKYRVYAVNLKDETHTDILHKALDTNDGAAITRLKPLQVGVVEFAAGIQALESAADVIAAEWRGKAPDKAQLVYGAVASTGEVLDDGIELSRARLANLGNVLATVTPRSDDARIETLSSIPDAAIISAAPHDGVMVFATLPVMTTCHQVFRLSASEDITKELFAVIQSTSATNLDEEFKRLNVELIGNAVFQEGNSAILESASDDLGKIWTEQGDGAVNKILMISQRPVNNDAPTEAEKQQIGLFKVQASSISKAVGTDFLASDVTFAPPEDGEPSPCPAITILVNHVG